MRLYHGGNIDGPTDPYARGLWATDDLSAARDYATTAALNSTTGTACVHQIQVPDDAVICSLDDAASRSICLDPQTVAAIVEGRPDLLSASTTSAALAEELTAQGVWAVHVPAGDCHPDSGREHASWWIPAQPQTTIVEQVQP